MTRRRWAPRLPTAIGGRGAPSSAAPRKDNALEGTGRSEVARLQVLTSARSPAANFTARAGRAASTPGSLRATRAAVDGIPGGPSSSWE